MLIGTLTQHYNLNFPLWVPSYESSLSTRPSKTAEGHQEAVAPLGQGSAAEASSLGLA